MNWLFNIFRRKKKVSNKSLFYHYQPIKQNVNKLCLLHYIKTDKADYNVYNIDPIDGTATTIWIERDNVSILESEVFDESWGTLGADSFSTFVSHCLGVLRSDIKSRGEFIIDDKKID